MSVSSPEKLLIDADEFAGTQDETLRVIYPADATTEVGRCHLLSAGQIESVLNAAQSGFETFRKTTHRERAQILERLAQLIEAHAADLARLITMEAGKPIKLSKAEVNRAAGIFRGYAEAFFREKRELFYMKGCESEIRYFPLGPVLAITPYNFPLNLIVHKLAPAIAAGNSITIRPSSKTPLTALYLGRLAVEAGYSAISVVPCQADVAESLVRAEVFKKLSFTGSSEVGWRLKSLAGRKTVTLELGGNAACIIEDYEPGKVQTIAKRVAQGGFWYSGQVCISVQRVLVNHRFHDEFVQALLAEARAMKVGDPLKPETDVGPMISVDDVFRARELVKESIRDGANVLYGGNTYNTYTMNPTVFNRTTPHMRINREEVFAPIVTVAPYNDLDEAMKAANDTRYGLQAGIYTQDQQKAQRAFETLEVGGVMINQVPTFRLDELPYGGVKDSGLGREGIMTGLADMSNMRVRIENTELYQDCP